jgi:hypothetical protein
VGKRKNIDNSSASSLQPCIDATVITKLNGEGRIGTIVDEFREGKIRAWVVEISQGDPLVRQQREFQVIFRPGGERGY